LEITQSDRVEQEILKKLNLIEWKAQINFEAYGTRVGIRSNCVKTIENFKVILPEILPAGWNDLGKTAPDYLFSIVREDNHSKKDALYKNDEVILEEFSIEESWAFIKSQIRITVAEFSEEYVFLHAGVVGWKGRAVIMPGKSFAGKTTLVSEFVKRGADYYSDDLTVIDKNGYVHPFPKKLSIRGILENNEQVDFEVEELGGSRGLDPIPVGALILTEYKKHKKPEFSRCSVGHGIMKSIENSLSVRQSPKFVINVLNKITKDAIILESSRREAKEFVDFFLKLLDDSCL